MTRRRRASIISWLGVMTLAGSLSGCAAHQAPVPGKPIEERPRPPQPQTTATTAAGDTVPVPPPRVITPSGEESVRAMMAKDTLAVHKALTQCAGKTLLPEMESTYIATEKLLAQTREALRRGDVTQARSLARNARSLVSSLECP